ncbi:MAG TPA: trigger factor [Candidatus Saccharimonadales bacterium]|nr:trigger factor [Candidatus Saccharimonadales bacterium]
MKLVNKLLSDTKVALTISGEPDELMTLKDHVVGHFINRIKVPGFRSGKAPLSLIERQIDANELQSEFLEEAVNSFYRQAIDQAKLRPIEQPEIIIKKFVPFTTLEFEAKLSVIGEIVLPDYKKLKVIKAKVTVSDKDVEDVLESLRSRLADKSEVKRPAKNGDELSIDFTGTDAKGEPISGAAAKAYTLILGSKSFIPGFEDNLIGLTTGGNKTFKLKFPKDYGVKSLANQTVEFEVKVNQVQELSLPKVDDKLAVKAGPFKNLKELTTNIKQQLVLERQTAVQNDFESALIKAVADKSQVKVPQVLVDEQVDKTLEELKRDIVYRGQTYQEYLDQEKISDEQNRQRLEPAATEQVKAGLILSEISEQENIDVSEVELIARMDELKSQYKDQQMQAELNKASARREIAGRIITEKTIKRLVELNS